MTLLSHAEHELDIIGMKDGDAMRSHILHMIEEFSKEGHSGFSANYAINCLSKLLKYEPLTPLTGEDSEWREIAKEMVAPGNAGTLYQNIRASHVFKDDNGPYDINGRVFYDWCERELEPDDEGYPGTRRFKSYFTSRDSRVMITFPYTPSVVYVERPPEE